MGTATRLNRPPRPWGLAVLASTIVINAVGFAIYTSSVKQAANAATVAAAPAAGERNPEVLAAREEGLKAIQEEDYRAAVTHLARAVELDQSDGESQKLLQLAVSLRSRQERIEAEDPAGAAKTDAPEEEAVLARAVTGAAPAATPISKKRNRKPKRSLRRSTHKKVAPPPEPAEPSATSLASVKTEMPKVEPEKGRVDILTNPPGAAVKVAGKPRGRAPIVGLQLDPGREVAIVIHLDGYKTWRTRITPQAGTNPTVIATLEGNAPAAAPSPAPATAAAPKPQQEPDIRIAKSVRGNPVKGQSLTGARCGSCHGKSAPKLDSRRYTQAQWSRYFAYGRHTRRARLDSHVNEGELADIKAYLMSTAADVKSATAAGVR